MELILGALLFILLAAFAIWRSRVDQSKNGPISKEVRLRTYALTLVWLAVLIITFYIYMPGYIGIIVLFLLYSQIFGVGAGKHGFFRQLRDSGFIASVASIPICLLLWNYGNA